MYQSEFVYRLSNRSKIVLWFPGPKSYTGEDMAELHVHGSKAVIKELQETIISTKKCKIDFKHI